MASENVNGVMHAASSGTPAPASPSTAQASQGSTIAKEEVAWYFVERYYNTMSKEPERLYLFFNRRSQFVAGVEEEKVHVCMGQKVCVIR